MIVEHDFFGELVPNWVHFGQGEVFKLTTEVKSLYTVPFSCKAFSRYMRCLSSLCAVAFNYMQCFFHYIHGTLFSLNLKRGQLRIEVKMMATIRSLKKTHLTELFYRDNNTDMISNQQGTGGHDEFAITIMLHICLGTQDAVHRDLTFRNQYWKMIWKRASQSRRFPVWFQSVERTIYIVYCRYFII